MEYDGSWLATELTKVLDGWDLDVANSIVGAIDASSNRQEVDDLIMNYMEGAEAARSVVYKFLDYKAKVESQDWTEEAPAPPPETRQDGKRKGRSNTKSGSSSRPAAQFSAAHGSSSEKSRGKEKRMEGKMKKKSKGVKPAHIDEQIPTIANLKKKVVNCLNCGKIYDCRKVTEEILKFLGSNGTCLYCGASVNLRYTSSPNNSEAAERNKEAQKKLMGTSTGAHAPAAAQSSSGSLNPGGSSNSKLNGSTQDEAVSQAVEFKNRLIDYDRNHTKRTTVIDDQSDYFEIETNVWLSNQERKELRDRYDHERDVAEQRKRQVKYTIDLVGRRVMVAEDPSVSDESKSKARLAEKAASATSKEFEQGGGSAAGAAREAAGRLGGAAVLAGGQALRNLKAMANPSIPGPAPIFLPSKDSQLMKEATAKKGNRWARGYGARLQHEDVFAGFESEAEVAVMFEDLASILNTQTEGSFDICPEVNTTKEAIPNVVRPERGEVKVSANVRLSNMLVPSVDRPASTVQGPEPKKLSPGDRLPPGMVLLKGALTLEQQVRIVNEVRKLGQGVGGFYTPSYTDGAELSLKMMCLGKHWDPRSRCYEDIRSAVDGAQPPSIPDFLKDLVQEYLKQASNVWGNKYPEMQPNVCLCNFYTSESSLGLHQDKEEGPESCRRRIPVVSFSIGATGLFVFNKKQSMDGGSAIDLESGDVLVFGGPSRMIYHGIRKINPETMPPELEARTGMRTGRLNLTFRQYIPPEEEA